MTHPVATAKVFTTGRSPAVRLPKAFRLDTAEVTVAKVGDAVVLRPKLTSKDEWWAAMERMPDGFEGMPKHIERDRSGLGDPVRLD